MPAAKMRDSRAACRPLAPLRSAHACPPSPSTASTATPSSPTPARVRARASATSWRSSRSARATRAATSGWRRSPTRRPGPAADKPAFWVDGNIHATEVAASAANALFPAHAGHAIRQGRRHHARARHARVLPLPAHQSRRRRMGARRPAEVDPLEHAAVSVRRGGDRGADRRGHRRRRPHPADAHRRSERRVEGASGASRGS